MSARRWALGVALDWILVTGIVILILQGMVIGLSVTP